MVGACVCVRTFERERLMNIHEAETGETDVMERAEGGVMSIHMTLMRQINHTGTWGRGVDIQRAELHKIPPTALSVPSLPPRLLPPGMSWLWGNCCVRVCVYLFYVGGGLGWSLHEDEAMFPSKGLSLLLLHLSPRLQVAEWQKKSITLLWHWLHPLSPGAPIFLLLRARRTSYSRSAWWPCWSWNVDGRLLTKWSGG